MNNRNFVRNVPSLFLTLASCIIYVGGRNTLYPFSSHRYIYCITSDLINFPLVYLFTVGRVLYLLLVIRLHARAMAIVGHNRRYYQSVLSVMLTTESIDPSVKDFSFWSTALIVDHKTLVKPNGHWSIGSYIQQIIIDLSIKTEKK